MKQKFTSKYVREAFDKLGITRHYGGIPATERLIGLCNIKPDQHVLEIGCGSGYTACLLAKEYNARVTALDIGQKLLERTRKRAIEQGVGNKVETVQADAQELDFPTAIFDAAITESVLVLCDSRRASSGVYRTLKPKGVFGVNELTLLKSPPEELVALFSDMGIRLLWEDEWRAVFREAGFSDVSSNVYQINMWEDAISRFQVDGIGTFLSAVVSGFLDTNIRNALTKDAIREWRRFPQSVGYGLYVCRKT